MRFLTRSLLLSAAGLFAVSAQSAAEEASTRPEQRYELFRVSTAPAVIPKGAAAKLAENKFQREILYTRWLQVNPIDFANAKPNDRVVVAISEGESFELELTAVVNPTDQGTLWYGRFPNVAGNTLFVLFMRPKNVEREPTFNLATLNIPLQGRQLQITTAEELPGWALLREIKPGTGTHLDHSNDTGGPEWRAYAEKEAERLRREQERKNAAPPVSDQR